MSISSHRRNNGSAKLARLNSLKKTKTNFPAQKPLKISISSKPKR